MGSEVTLDIGNLCVDYGKNFVNDHSALFRPEDLGTAEYDYVGDDDQPIAKEKEAYVATLRDVLPRLRLLGFSIDSLRRRHDQQGVDFPFDGLVEPGVRSSRV
jgi:hypothetical protein